VCVLLCFIRTDVDVVGYRGFPQGSESPHPSPGPRAGPGYRIPNPGPGMYACHGDPGHV